jgi:restriction system protein
MSTPVGSAAVPTAVTHQLASVVPAGQALSPRTLVGVLIAALVAFAAVAVYQRIRVARSGIAGVDRMDVKTFEAFLASLFRDLGYELEGSRTHGDFAAELVVVKDGMRTVVEGKRWSKNLGVTAVQEALGAMTDYACDSAIVVANRQFTHQAKKLAQTNGIQLWDREALVGKLLGLHGVPGELPSSDIAIPELAAAVTAPPAGLAAAPVATASVPVRVATAPPAAVPRWTPGTFASCALCGMTVSKEDRIACLSQPGRFGGQIYCHAHQQLIRGDAALGGTRA